jgi:hypothetical protein
VLGLTIWLSARLRNHYRKKRFEQEHPGGEPATGTVAVEIPTTGGLTVSPPRDPG